MPKLKVATVPADANPYQRELSKALAPLGFDVTMHTDLGDVISRSVSTSRKPDIVHLHWLPKCQPTVRGAVKLASFVARLCVLRAIGIRVVWTVHNLYHHEMSWRWAEKILGRIVLRLASGVIVHSESAREIVSVEFSFNREDRLTVVPHGNYIGAYENVISRDHSRHRLRLATDAIVFLFLGHIRPYKGLSELVEVFRKIPLSSAVLLIRGLPIAPGIADQLKRIALDDERLRIQYGFVDDRDIQLYMNACDVVVCPYRDVLTSGSVILAMSFGKACIAPSAGCIPDVLDCEGGYLYDPGSPQGLLDAILRAIEERRHLRTMGEHNLRRARSWDWKTVAKATAFVYEQALDR